MAYSKGKVAVIGLGAYGLVTLKNLLEEGFDVVGYERNTYVGGLWKFTPDVTRVSVLPSTISTFSKQRNCYTDFPFPDDVPDFPTSSQVHQYLEDYADFFKLRPHFRLGTSISNIRRSEDDETWIVSGKDQDSQDFRVEFDKVVVSTGAFQNPVIPYIDGIEAFEGKIIHSTEFKNAQDFKDKNVIVVGLMNTGADTAVELHGFASKIYISHRNGARILPRRRADGRPADHEISLKLMGIAKTLDWLAPSLSSKLMSSAMEKAMREGAPKIDPRWKLLPAPPPAYSHPVFNDEIMNLLADGSVTSVPGISKINSSRSVTFTDGTSVNDVDAIIFSTGYSPNFDFLAPEIDPTNGPTPEYDAAQYGSSVRRYIRLYQGIFSPKYATSLAFNGPYLIISAFTGADVVSQAIAQVFSGGYPLPPDTEIQKWCMEHYSWSVKQATQGRTTLALVRNYEVEKWLNQACGNGLEEKLGRGLEGWKFWWMERDLYSVAVNGVATGFTYRLFDGRRKKWAGAKEAIYKANGKGLKP